MYNFSVQAHVKSTSIGEDWPEQGISNESCGGQKLEYFQISNP